MADSKSFGSSAVVGFNSNAEGRRLVIETDNSEGLVPVIGSTFVRVFPTQAQAKVTAVLGTAQKIATAIPLEVVDYVSFNNASSASLRYYPSGPVEISNKKFFGPEPAVSYDEVSNSIVLDSNAFGIVKLSYTAQFDRYLVGHGDSPCAAATTQTQGGVPARGQPVTYNYDPAFIVAEALNWGSNALEVSGPSCDQGAGGSGTATAATADYRPLGLKIETDPLYPPAIWPASFSGFSLQPVLVVIGGLTGFELHAGCRIRVFPSIGARVVGINCNVSGRIETGSVDKSDPIVFGGAHSQNTGYPIVGRCTLSPSRADAVDTYGNIVSAEFKGPGDWVNEVQWTSANSYRIAQGSRSVKENEIVCVTSLGRNTLPAFTFTQAEYTTSFDSYEVQFTWNAAKGWFNKAMVVAIDPQTGRPGSLEIEPPAPGGVL